MSISPERESTLNELAECLADLFPEDAEFWRHEDADRNFVISWKLAGQPKNLTQISREISVRLSEAAVAAYPRLNLDRQAAARARLRQSVSAQLDDFSDGRDSPRGAVKQPFIISVPNNWVG
jgi:hypothetical protein